MSTLKYLFRQAEYHYGIMLIHPLLELYRMHLFHKLVYKIRSLVNQKYLDTQHQINFHKLKKIFSKWILRIISQKIQTTDIYLDDGFFNYITEEDSQKIYKSLNKYFQGTRLSNDEFRIQKRIEKIIQKLKKYELFLEGRTEKIFQYHSNQFIIKKQVLEGMEIGDLSFNFPRAIYLRLEKKFTGPENLFDSYILCCLLRYHTLGDKNIFLTVDTRYQEELRKYFFNFECYSTVFTHQSDNYGSPFYDIERYFGSTGHFFGLDIQGGCYAIYLNTTRDVKVVYRRIKKFIKSPHPVSFILSFPKSNCSMARVILDEKIYKEIEIKYMYLTNVFTEEKYLDTLHLNLLFYNESYLEKVDMSRLKNFLKKFENYYLEYPFRNKIYGRKYKLCLFKKLLSEKLQYKTDTGNFPYQNIKLMNFDYQYHGKYFFVMSDEKKYKYYMLSDLFNDECRSFCHFGDHPSPYNYWMQNKKSLVESIQRKNMEINPINLREEIYLQSPECSIHNPLLIKYFIKKYRARKILDPSSGWGDRLIGALLSDIDLYVGVDPNECLHQNYLKMIKLFSPLAKNPRASYQMLKMGFQDYHNPEGVKFDLIYTSPPYFDYEIYSPDPSQSIKLAPSENRWLTDFIYLSIDKSLSYLVNRGHLILYFSQQRGRTYMEKFILWIKWHPGIYYLGNFFYSNLFQKKLHPIFIVQKLDHIPRVLYNPKIQITRLEIYPKKINKISDDLLLGGTYLRGLVKYLEGKNDLCYIDVLDKNEIAIAYALQLLKSRSAFYIYSKNPDRETQKIVQYIYPHSRYVTEKFDHCYHIPPNLDHPDFRKTLKESLLKAGVDEYPIKKLWIDISYYVLFYCLYEILPNTHFEAINKINFPIDAKYLERTKIHLDGKNNGINLFENLISHYGEILQDGDYIWNTIRFPY